MDDSVKRIYVSDLTNTTIDLKNEKELNEDQIKDDGTKKILFTGTTTKYQMKKVDSTKDKKEKKKNTRA